MLKDDRQPDDLGDGGIGAWSYSSGVPKQSYFLPSGLMTDHPRSQVLCNSHLDSSNTLFLFCTAVGGLYTVTAFTTRLPRQLKGRGIAERTPRRQSRVDDGRRSVSGVSDEDYPFVDELWRANPAPATQSHLEQVPITIVQRRRVRLFSVYRIDYCWS